MVLNEEQLIEGIKQRDRQCQSEFYNRHASALYGIALRYTESDDNAKDVLQDAFIRIFDSIEQYNGTGVVRAWMSRIVVNEALTVYKQKKRRLIQSIDAAETQMELKDESIVVSDMLTHEILLQFIQELSEGYRVVFNLHEMEGYSHDEIAEMLNCSPSTSRSQLFKAKNLLRKKINDFNDKEERI